jgi:iron complex transport system permease protein
VAIVIMAGGSAAALFAKSFTIALAASIGCGFIFIIILAVAQRVRDNISLLLIGLMIGAVTSSIVSVLQFTSRAEDQQYYLVWTFGSIGSLNWSDLRILGLAVVIGAAISIRSVKSLNAWLLGDHYATSLGVRIKRSRLLIIIATSILTGAVTAFCGPIGFIGLAVPHVTRLLVDTTNHKILIPAVMIMGAAALLFCDILSHLPGTSFMLPINSITALLGAPVVIWIILRNKKIRM